MLPNTNQRPKNWPPGLLFTTATAFHPIISRAQQSLHLESLKGVLETACLPTFHLPPQKGPSNAVHIKPINDPKHPAQGQYGLFAAKNFEPGSHIIDYVGWMFTDETASKTSDYSLRLCPGVSLDAELAGNEARFCNDYRGVRPKPNAQFELYRDKSTQGIAALRMGIFCGKDGIKRGEELCISYGKGFWAARRLEEQTSSETDHS